MHSNNAGMRISLQQTATKAGGSGNSEEHGREDIMVEREGLIWGKGSVMVRC
jgi:hypothetical protein